MIRLKDIAKTFLSGSTAQTAVKNVSLDIGSSEFIILSGRSGSGKTTLLNIMGGLEIPDRGDVLFEEQNIRNLSDAEISNIRRAKIGFIFQTFNLIPVISALENVEYPLTMLGVAAHERRDRAREILGKVGLEKHIHSKPGKLSGGQRQRVAIARALVKNPHLILADEPTANLDVQTSQDIVHLIQDLFTQQKGSIVFCTHDTAMVGHGTRWLEMSDGQLLVDRRKS